MSLNCCAFFLPFFLLFFEFAHGWIKLSFPTTRMLVCMDYNLSCSSYSSSTTCFWILFAYTLSFQISKEWWMELFCLFGMLNEGSLLPFAPNHPHPLVFATTKFCINLSSIIVKILLQTPLWPYFPCCSWWWRQFLLRWKQSKEVYYNETCLHLLLKVVGGVCRLCVNYPRTVA